MVKKAKSKVAKKGLKAKDKLKYTCDACGMIVAVEEPCTCDSCDIVCCGEAMRAVSCAC